MDTFERVADTPGKGHRRGDLINRDVLFFRVYQYMCLPAGRNSWYQDPGGTSPGSALALKYLPNTASFIRR